MTVSNLNDSGPGSLREQVAAAVSGDTIDFGVTGIITLSSGEISIAKNLTISGPQGTPGITVSGNGTSRVFNIGGGSVSLSRLTLSGGNGGGTGGAIYNSGALTLSYSTISGSSATNGAGIYNTGSATVDSCTLSGNSGGNGGALYNYINASLTVKNSTLSGNTAGGGEGGGIFNLGATTISSSTIFGNSATSNTGGGGIGQGAYVGSFTNLSNSILAGNTGYLGGSSDFRGVVSGDYNLVQNAGSQGNFGSNTIFGLDPQLGPLADNGGPTKTMALLSNSQVINAGNPGFDAVATPYDQRGAGYARKIANAVDLGAVESAFTNRMPIAVNTSFTLTPDTYFSSALTASDRDSGDTLTYTILTGTLPTGLTFDTATGIISGTTGGFAARTLTFKATDSNGTDSNTATATLGAMEINSLLVNTNSDAANNTDGLTSIREAVAYANTANAGTAPVITFAGDITGTITLTSGVMTITRSMTITGPGASSLALNGINGNGARSIFDISTGVVDVSGLTLSGGRGTFYTVTVGGVTSSVRSGGALYITGGTVTVTNSALSDNPGSTGYGGAIFMTGGGLTVSNCTLSRNSNRYGGVICLKGSAVATITNSTLSDNDAGFGGAIYTSDSTDAITIRSSTLSGNDASGTGGGILTNGGPVTIANSTLSNNRAMGSTNGRGGGIYVGGASGGTTITNSTLTKNYAYVGGNLSGGGGIFGGPVNMSNTIVCGNFGNNPNIGSSTITGTHNLIDQDAMLGVLTSNGGPTQTHALLAGSPAIDAGDPNFNNTSTPYDQRGSVFLRKSSGAIDIGAYEVQGAADTTPPTISISAPSSTVANPGGTVTYTITYADANFLSSSLTPGNVTLNRSGTINASVSVTSSTVFTRTVTLSGITGYGTLGISIVAGTATDSTGNTAPAAGPSGTFTVNPSVETVQRSGTIRAAAGGGYEVGYVGNPGQQYTIQFSSDLLPPWQTLGTQVANSSGVISITDNPPAGTPRRFYRLLLP
ncbi:MAG: choice-of-anchor Q domain-containing protein [Verrucomicrobiota bacterium]